MKINSTDKEFIKFLQEGGAMEDPNAAPAEPAPTDQGGDPTQQILAACQQALETQDCNLAMQILQTVMQMLGGSAEPAAPTAPEGAAPVYKQGGKLSKWVSK